MLAASWLLAVQTSAAETLTRAVPFVGGFERLARHDEIDESLSGRLLISELSCTACHASSDSSLRSKAGPDLSSAGNRLNLAWLQRFIASPSEMKPGTTMPDVLQGLADQERETAVVALTAYLGSLRQPLPEVKATGTNPVPHQFWLLGDAERGRTLFHQVGCIACHQPDPEHETAPLPPSPTDHLLDLLEPEELESLGLAAATRTTPVQPLGALAEQYSLHSLTLFLLQPEATRPGGRMPNFQLAPVEAADVAAYLMRRTPDHSSPLIAIREETLPDTIAEEALVAEGRRLFVTLDCARCHRADVEPSQPQAPPLSLLTLDQEAGCVVSFAAPVLAKRSDTQPRYQLDSHQFAAIGRALEHQRQQENQSVAVTSGEVEPRLQLELLRYHCHACHQRDGLGGIGRDRRAYFETVGHVDLGDEGRLPPPLSGVGRKPRPAWLERVIQGNGAIRPFMLARMPKFPPAVAKELTALLVQCDRATAIAREVGIAPNSVASHAPPVAWPDAADAQQFAAGRQMMDSGCVQCHVFGGEALPGVVGVDLRGIGDRVEPAWFREFLFNPGAVKERTRMPNFFPDGVSQNRDLLGGDANRQIAAMWGYLKALPQQPLPEQVQIARAKNFELVPDERPIVMRTFMREAGTHAIAVGMPEQVHYAFDAHTLRLATAWRGRFLDAQGTWFIRSAPPADPLGDELLVVQRRPLVSATDLPQRFLGYQLDQFGRPTFSYRVGDLLIDDRISPLHDATTAKRAGLKRHLRLQIDPQALKSETSPAVPPSIELLSGKRLTWVSEQAVQREDGLVVTLMTPLKGASDPQSISTDAEGMTTWNLTLVAGDDGKLPEARRGADLVRPAPGETTAAESFDLELTYQW